MVYKRVLDSVKYKKVSRTLKKIISKNFLNNKKFYPNNIDRVYHYHIRKSGGTSINSIFWELAGYNSLSSVNTEPILIGNHKSIVRIDKKLIESGDYFYASSHFPLWSLHLKPNTFTFTILREPYERVVSLYKYYQWVYQVDEKIAPKIDPSYYYLKKQTHLQNVSFLEFISNLSKKHLYGELYFYSEKMLINEALINLEKVDVVFFKDNFLEIMPTLSRKLNLNFKNISRERSFQNIIYSINDEEEKFAKNILKNEIEFYLKAKIKFNGNV
jgi:hypothetical protein